jgi:hypothetical protein
LLQHLWLLRGKAAFDSSSSSTFREHLLLKLMTIFVVCPLLLYHCRHRPYPRFCFALPLAVATPFCSYPLERSLSDASQLPFLGNQQHLLLALFHGYVA